MFTDFDVTMATNISLAHYSEKGKMLLKNEENLTVRTVTFMTLALVLLYWLIFTSRYILALS